MTIIILYYLFLFFLILPFGVFTKKIVRLNNSDSSISIIFGLIFLTIFFSFWAFFFRLNYEIFYVTVLLSVILSILYRKDIKIYFENLKTQWKSFSSFYKKLFSYLVFLTAFKSSGLPFIIDNESYYIQTIKWLNEYGFVKGLANLHLFLAQNSGWHTLQAGLNFSFISDRINDINGFIFLICSFFYLSEFQKKQQKNWIGFVLIFNVLLFQFIDTPSPDLPLLLVSQILFYFFLEKQTDTSTGKISVLLFLWLIFIKLTIAPLGLLLLLWINKPKVLKFLLVLGTFFGILWIAKNSIISGYPLYPFNYFALDVDWLVPEKLRFFIDNLTRKASYFNNSNLPDPSFYEKLKHWFFLPGINTVFNIGTVFLFLLVLFTKSFRKEKKHKLLYIILLIHFILILIISPQFRFFLPEFIFFSIIIIRDFLCWYKKINFTKPILITGVLLPFIFLFPISISKLTTNVHHQLSKNFSITQLIIPQPSSKYYDMKFEVKEKGNLLYYSPQENFFFYGTANGNLPCVNEAYLNYFYYNCNFYPQMRSSDLKDGFYSYDNGSF